MLRNIKDFAPDGVESGVGLALQDAYDRYLFFLAGTRHKCPPGELFFAGTGGHREHGEDWVECAQREALEEIGTGVTIDSSSTTWHFPEQGPPAEVNVSDRPRPLALYTMIHPPNTPRSGMLYRLVIYCARLQGTPRELPPEEVSGVIALPSNLVILGPERSFTLGQLLEEGATMVLEPEEIDRQIRLYPLGTAVALAHILSLKS